MKTMKKAFTLLEILVATMLLAMLVTILTMIFNQSSIAWSTGVASVAGLRNVRERIALGAAESENMICRDKQSGSPIIITSVWSSWEKGRTLASTLEESSSVTWSDMQDPLPDRTYAVGASTAAGRDAYIVGVTSWGPDGQRGTWDDITTMPEEIVK